MSAYRLFEHLRDQLEPGRLFVEIGSERGGGSTYYLNNLARETRNDFVTVDVDPIYLGTVINTATMSGERFASEVLPKLGKMINLVYLDGFDWTDEPALVRNGSARAEVYNLIGDYAAKNMEMNNLNCTLAHARQIQGLLPFMTDQCAVLFEKTWFQPTMDTLVGKGAGGAMMLMANGFTIQSASPREKYLLLTRNINVSGVPNLDISALGKQYTGAATRADLIIYKNTDK